MVMGMQNFQKPGYGGVTETWNVIQHEVISSYWSERIVVYFVLQGILFKWLCTTQKPGYGGVTETWNVFQFEVIISY